MRCPFCGYDESKVVDSRTTQQGESIRRRRECLQCHRRFTTFEIVEKTPLVVIKREGNRERFDRRKIIDGLLRACEKRPVSLETIEKIAQEVEVALYNEMEREVSSHKIGELVLQKLSHLDPVAYVRFASVYRQFKDISEFSEEIKALLKNKETS